MHPLLQNYNMKDSTNTYKRSKEIASYVVKKQLGQKQKWNNIGEKMYELCTKMRLKHEPFFNGVSTRLGITRNTILETCKSVQTEILNEGCSFGRIVSLYTFCMVLCEHCNENEYLSDRIDEVINITVEVLLEHQPWFQKNGNWDGFLAFFTSPKDKLWKGLAITTVGLGAVAGIFYVNS